MCAVSYVSDYARDTLPGRYPGLYGPDLLWPAVAPVVDHVSRIEFEKLRSEVEELRKLLVAAKEFDAKTGQHECETAEKVAFLKKLAEFVGVDLKSVLEE